MEEMALTKSDAGADSESLVDMNVTTLDSCPEKPSLDALAGSFDKFAHDQFPWVERYAMDVCYVYALSAKCLPDYEPCACFKPFSNWWAEKGASNIKYYVKEDHDSRSLDQLAKV